MNKKTLLQLLLLSFVILIITTFFFTYFYEKPKKNELTKNELTDQNIIKEEDASNLIQNIEYLSFDNEGNEYEIIAESGKIKNDNSEIIYMKNVKAKINFINSESITIESDLAIYNSKNYNTYFSKNIKINYLENKIECQKLDLLFIENLALLYDSIIYTNLKTKLFADRLEIDLITKNSKISMDDKNKKIEMFYSK